MLTEQDSFRGSLDDLREARDATALPVLRKDFVVDDYQVYESVAAGADALLLIVAALSDDDLKRLINLCTRFRITPLVEVHREEEVRRATDAGASVVGVNNRNLKTLAVDLNTSIRLRPLIPVDCLAVAESGIRSASDVARLRDAGFDAALIGERFMTQPDPGKGLKDLLRSVSEMARARE